MSAPALGDDDAAPMKPESEQVIIAHKPQAAKIEPVEDAVDQQAIMPHIWPFDPAVRSLAADLSASAWETRHGAALGLLSILKSQGASGGKQLALSTALNATLHATFAEEVAFHLLRVLALDRFGDYVGDSVVAPVRETASMALAALMKSMAEPQIQAVLQALTQMAKQEGMQALVKEGQKPYVWQVRHAGLVGIKYLVAVQPDLFRNGADALKELSEVAMTGFALAR